jgi:hypothetical protein
MDGQVMPFRRWFLAPVLREIHELRQATSKGLTAMADEMADLAAAEAALEQEVTFSIAEIANLAGELKQAAGTPSAVETIAHKINDQVVKLKAAREAAATPTVPAEPDQQL